MTTSAEVLADAIERVRQTSRSAGKGLSSELLEARLDPAANTIAWLLWHLARGQDAQVAAVMGVEQVWTADGWSGRFGLSLPVASTGYAHSADDVARVSGVSSELLLGYLDAVCDRTSTYVSGLSDDDLDRIVDERFTPPVTLAVRLVSAVSDNLQHSGQAAFIRGVLERKP
jgi:hypothetical protein